MKKYVAILLFMPLIFVMFASVGHAATPVPKLYLNGTLLQTDVAPQIVGGHTLVPVALLSQSLGYNVDWNGDTQTVTINQHDTTIVLVIGQKAANVNGEVTESPAAPQLIDKRTMVPVRFVGQLLGLEFEWKQDEWAVYMTEAVEEPVLPETPPEPEVPAGYITGVWMDEQSVIHISHSSATAPGKPLLLNYADQPLRLVFDFPNTTFTPELFAQFQGGLIEHAVADNERLTGFRYSQFMFSPLTARLTVVIGEDTGFVLSEHDNEFQIALLPLSEVPEPEEMAEEVEIPVVEEEEPTAGEGEAKRYRVVIDAGHGGSDPGAMNKTLNLMEKTFNLSLALKLKAELAKHADIEVLMTRSDDRYIDLAGRIQFAEESKADLFLSIHANSFKNADVNGAETYYERPESKALAEVIHSRLLKGTGLADRGVKKAAFKVIKETTMPAVLIEAGFLSNEKDARKLFEGQVQDKLALELAGGIVQYLQQK